MESIDLKVNLDVSEIEKLKETRKDVAQGFDRLNRELGTMKGTVGDLNREVERLKGMPGTVAQGFDRLGKEIEGLKGSVKGAMGDITRETDKLTDVPKQAAQGFERLKQDIVALKGPLGDLAREHAKRMQGISEAAAGQGFFTPQQSREFQRSGKQLSRLFGQHYAEMIQAAKQGGTKFEKELQDLGDRIAKAKGKEKDALTKQMGQVYQQYQQYVATGGATNVQPILNARQGTQQSIQNVLAQGQLAALLNPPPGQPPTPPNQPQQQGGGMGGLAVAGQLMRGLVGAYSVYAIAGKIRRDFMGELERMIAVADMGQRVRPVGMSGGQFQGIAKELEPTLRPEESTRFLQRYSELAGNTLPMASEAVGLTRALGFAPEEGAQRFGQLGRMGLEQDRFAKKLAEEIAKANMQGRQGEMFDALMQMAEEMTQRLGRVQDQDALASLLGRLSSQGLPGLQGQYGAATIMGMDQAFRGQNLFQLPDMGAIGMLTMFTDMGITDPAKMNRIKSEGLIAHPETWKPLFNTIEKYGGMSSILGQGIAESRGIPLPLYEPIKKALTSKDAPGYWDYLKRVLGPEEAAKLNFAKAPQMFNVAKQFQERAAAGGFSSPEQEREQLIAALQKEDVAMADELRTRREMVKASQAWTDVVDLGVKGFTDLVGDKLPKFGQALDRTYRFVEKHSQPFPDMPSFPGLSLFKRFFGDIETPTKTLQGLENLSPGARKDLLRVFPSLTPDQLGNVQWGIPSAAWTAETGRLPRGYSTSRSIEGIEASSAVIAAIKKHARSAGLSFDQAAALAYGESRFDPRAKSHTGDFGLFQIHAGPGGPAPHLTPEQLLDPETNASVALPHFARLLKKYGKSETAIAAWNRGETRVPVGTDVTNTWQPLSTRSLIDRHNEYLTGSVTVYLRDEKTGALRDKSEAVISSRPGISGMSTTSPALKRAH